MRIRVDRRLIMGSLCAAVLGLSLAACEEEGPAEKLGENIDDAIEETGEAMEQAVDEIERETQPN